MTAKMVPSSDFPERVVIELTPLCNLSCGMCPRHYIRNHHGFITERLWIKLIDEIRHNRPDAIVLPFWRGESLLHPRFVELMRYALDRKVRIHISTNGHAIGEDEAGALAECEFVTFSIHTGKGYRNAREFLLLRREGKPTVQVSFVKGEKSTEEFLPEILKAPSLGGFDSVRLYEEHTREGIFGKSAGTIYAERAYCQKLNDTLVIAFDGTVSRCNHVWETDAALDLNTITIRRAWRSPSAERIRREYPEGYCASCDQWTGHTCGESWRMLSGAVEHHLFGGRSVQEP